MPTAFHSPQAKQDLLEIAYQIAISDQRPITAERIIDDIVAKCNFYAGSPEIGTSAEEISEGCRVGRHKRWVIFYRLHPQGIEVVRIVDGARDYPNLFG